eukprot:CAMPEP_0114662100 /NCGR_PEP_ID=MMETSP0191-20121206/24081_1 /TAXON_ID=126664 /ORGANISM="Sorites sp." /LENGTH=35 /DNA_ID= /DNA_START= /DNA_END= /DNA_ORIENTATION=
MTESFDVLVTFVIGGACLGGYAGLHWAFDDCDDDM